MSPSFYHQPKTSNPVTLTLSYIFKRIQTFRKMALVRSLLGAKKILGRSVTATASTSKRVASAAPKGFLAVYVGENQKKRYVVPVSYLNHSISFRFKLFSVNLKKSLGLIIQWVA